MVPASTRVMPVKALALPANVKVPAPCLTKLPAALPLRLPEKLLLPVGASVSAALPMLMVPAPFSAARVWLPPSSSVAPLATSTPVVGARRLAKASVSVPPVICKAVLSAVPVSVASSVTTSRLPPRLASTEAPVVSVVSAVSLRPTPSSSPPRLSVATVSLPASTSRPPLFTVTAAPSATRLAVAPRVSVPPLLTVTAPTSAWPSSVPLPVTSRLVPARLVPRLTTPPVCKVCEVAVKVKAPPSVPASVLVPMVSLPPSVSAPPPRTLTLLLLPMRSAAVVASVPLTFTVAAFNSAPRLAVAPPSTLAVVVVKLPAPTSAPLSVRLLMVSALPTLSVPLLPTLTLPVSASTSLAPKASVPPVTVVRPV